MSNVVLTEYFPYMEFKSQQKQIIEEISAAYFDETQNMILQASTATGKTVATLSVLLAIAKTENKRLVVFTHTLNQYEPYLREWRNIRRYLSKETKVNSNTDAKINNFLHGVIPTILPLYGKSKICGNDFHVTSHTIINCKDSRFIKFSSYQKKKLLHKLIKKNKPSLLRWINEKMLDNEVIINTEFARCKNSDKLVSTRFLEVLKTRENCQYYNSQSLLSQADIVLLSGGYLEARNFDKIMNLMDTTASECIFIFDEAHNLLRSQSTELEYSSLLLFSNAFPNMPLLDEINKFQGTNREVDFNQFRDLKAITQKNSSLMRGLTTIREILDELKREQESQQSINSSLEQYIPSISTSRDKISKFVVNLKSNNFKFIADIDRFVILDTQPHEKVKLTNQAYFRIFQSATFIDLLGTKSLLGLPAGAKISNLTKPMKEMLKLNHQQVFCYPTLSMTQRTLSSKTYSYYACDIVELAKTSPNHTLVLVQSYRHMEALVPKIIQYLRDNGLDFQLLVENKRTNLRDIRDILTESEQRSIVLGVQRGKLMEGIEFTQNSINTDFTEKHDSQIKIRRTSLVSLVLFAGLSTPIPTLSNEKLKQSRIELLQSESKASFFEEVVPILQYIVQSLGRTTRHQSDNGTLVILDQKMSKYIEEFELSWIKIVHKREDLIHSIRSFYREFQDTLNILQAKNMLNYNQTSVSRRIE